MNNLELQQRVYKLLDNLQGLEPLKALFWSELNYHQIDLPLPRSRLTESANAGLADDPILFASNGDDFHIIYAKLGSDKLSRGAERRIVTQLLNHHPYALFIFSNQTQDRWHFLNVKYDKRTDKRRLFRRITIGPEERLRTASERIALLDLAAISPELFGLSPLTIQEQHDKAFDVEAVTIQFFDSYKKVFRALETDLENQTKNCVWAHDYALQFLNRLMFLYFIQRKRWLGNKPEFLCEFWENYQGTKQPKDTFFDRWLKVLFFEAFNNKYHGGHKQFPDDLNKILTLAPYLNGGLFVENALDTRFNFKITDAQFDEVFHFLEQYNFTIAEDSPLDQEVAVDPEMIGKVYESLVNVSEEADEQGDAGIFYTQRTEIDLMCRLSLVDNLTNQLGQNHKDLFYELMFALEPDEKIAADKKVTSANLWQSLDTVFRKISIVDPACGSGSFLVGMLHILDDLQCRANQVLGKQESSFDRKKRIIGDNLYGVDVMDWACHIAELRLWLALIIDAEFTPSELHVRPEPILPYFTFKIRCGDSLVQEVGGINFGHIKLQDIPSPLKRSLTLLQKEKIKFYNNDRDRKYRTEKELQREEFRLFREIISSRAIDIKNETKRINTQLEGPAGKQLRLDGSEEAHSRQMQLADLELQKQRDMLKTELDRVNQALDALKTAKDIPFVWDIAFVEIFESDDSPGFDIVIGNPPYVRQESISDPYLSRNKVTAETKRLYKSKLARSVYLAYPKFFGYKPGDDIASHKLDTKSDLYIYFYFHGLSLLNPKGTFCFITSNSWLDVGYGADLQEFLLNHTQVKYILDNQVKRSFAQADINTIIALFSAPDETKSWALDNRARFIMFKVPFEHILSPVIWEEIEAATDRKTTLEYRSNTIIQKALLDDGCEIPDEEETTGSKSHGPLIKVAKYIGNKWGGKYLRAPDIYWTILDKGKEKLVRLGDIAEVRRGFTTGANEFFYLDEQRIKEWGIESEFLKPVIKSPRECKRILIDPKDLKYKIFMCHKDKKELKGTAALEYISWGESQDFDSRPSCVGRSQWWDLGKQESFDFVVLRFRDKRNWNPINRSSSLFAGDIMFVGTWYDRTKVEINNSILNSTLLILISEIYGRVNLGDGLLTTYGPEILKFEFLKAKTLDKRDCLRLIEKFDVLEKRAVKSIFEEINEKDRHLLDNIIFDALGLTTGERVAVYEAVIQLVESRLKKAESV
ncbi:MAG: Eco57I restriction-modification methylase domain-containing protein [bacterium]